MAPKAAAKGKGAAPAAAEPAPPPAAPPPPAPAGPKMLFGVKLKAIHPKVKTMLIATFAAACFAIFLASTVGYIRLRLAKSNPYIPPLDKLRETIADGRRNPALIYNHYVTISDEVRQLPNYLSESKKDLRNRKAKYQSIFKKGKLRAAEEWELFGRNIYYISNGEKTWYDAESFCMSRDAHLASILTEDEQFFITSQLNHPTWIGLTDENVEGDWEWTDGSRVIIQFWSQGSPSLHDDDTTMDRDCAAIEPSRIKHNWNDTDCHELKRWICKESIDIKELSFWPDQLHGGTREY